MADCLMRNSNWHFHEFWHSTAAGELLIQESRAAEQYIIAETRGQQVQVERQRLAYLQKKLQSSKLPYAKVSCTRPDVSLPRSLAHDPLLTAMQRLLLHSGRSVMTCSRR